MPMLADTDIARALDDGDLSIGYSFVPNAEGVWVYQEPAAGARDDPDGRTLFENLSVKSRLALTIGPLVKPLDYSTRVPRHLRFEGHDGVVDLRRSRGGYRLRPGEAALVLTNEQIDLSHRIGALVLGRVSSHTDGLVINASYLDPTWSGVVRLHVQNTARHPVTLRLGNEVGRMFLFATPESTPDPLAVAHQGLHYGYSWKRILDDGIDPFPERAPVEPPRTWLRRLRQVNAMARRNVGYTAIGLLALLALPTLRAYQRIDNWSERFEQLDAVETGLAELADREPVAGIETLVWPSGAVVAEAKIELPEEFRYVPDRVFAVAEVESTTASPASSPVLITSVARVGGTTTLTIRAERVPPPPDVGTDGETELGPDTIDVRWLVVP